MAAASDSFFGDVFPHLFIPLTKHMLHSLSLSNRVQSHFLPGEKLEYRDEWLIITYWPQNVGCRVFEINLLHVWFYFIFPIHYCGNIYCYGHNVLEALKHCVTCSQHKALLSYVSASHFQCHHEQHSCVFVRCSLTDKPDMDLVFTELIQSSCQSHLPVKLSQFSQSHRLC